MAHPKLHDVAALAGVSPTTVSRVLNNRGYLSAKTKENVFAAIEQLDYRPNAIARSLQKSKTNLIALIFPSVTHPFYGEMATRLETLLTSQGYRVILCNSQGRPEREEQYLDMLRARQVDGIITSAHSDVIAKYPKLNAPLVTLDRELSEKYPNVRCKNRDAAAEVTAHLIATGAQSLLHITSNVSATNERQRSFKEQAEQAGVPYEVLEVGFATDPVRKRHMIYDYLNDHPEVDAIFGANDIYASHALHWAQEHGITVPERLQIVGFDGAEATRTLFPHLATVIQPLEAMAERAVERVLAAIESRETSGTAQGDILPAQFYRGATVR